MDMLLNFNGPSDARLFFFDTETTGLPRRWNLPLSAATLDNWPRMVQLAWMLCDDAGNVLAPAPRLPLPQGYTIPPDASRVHGITT
nr:hypothetical protein [Kiritimatiellia bacterium]